MAHEAGKGSRPRPFSIAQDEYEKRWDAIFGRDLEKENTNEEIDDKVTRNNSETQYVKENNF